MSAAMFAFDGAVGRPDPDNRNHGSSRLSGLGWLIGIVGGAGLWGVAAWAAWVAWHHMALARALLLSFAVVIGFGPATAFFRRSR
jgi:hypothetical protein